MVNKTSCYSIPKLLLILYIIGNLLEFYCQKPLTYKGKGDKICKHMLLRTCAHIV